MSKKSWTWILKIHFFLNYFFLFILSETFSFAVNFFWQCTRILLLKKSTYYIELWKIHFSNILFSFVSSSLFFLIMLLKLSFKNFQDIWLESFWTWIFKIHFLSLFKIDSHFLLWLRRLLLLFNLFYNAKNIITKIVKILYWIVLDSFS